MMEDQTPQTPWFSGDFSVETRRPFSVDQTRSAGTSPRLNVTSERSAGASMGGNLSGEFIKGEVLPDQILFYYGLFIYGLMGLLWFNLGF